MALPGHLKAAFQELRDKAHAAQKTMLTQKRGPALQSGAHITNPGHMEDKPDGHGVEDSCPDCAAGVCEQHGTGMDELEAIHGSHQGHEQPKPAGHMGGSGPNLADGSDMMGGAAGEMGHDGDEPAGHGVGGMKLGGHGKKKRGY